jgi:hypothetical protein
MARKVARDVADYVDGGFEVESIVGVGGSPSCGVHTTLDLPGALSALGARSRGPVDAEWIDSAVIRAATVTGAGLFIEALARELDRKGLTVQLREVSLI